MFNRIKIMVLLFDNVTCFCVWITWFTLLQIFFPLISLNITAINAMTSKMWITFPRLIAKNPMAQAITNMIAMTYNKFPIIVVLIIKFISEMWQNINSHSLCHGICLIWNIQAEPGRLRRVRTRRIWNLVDSLRYRLCRNR